MATNPTEIDFTATQYHGGNWQPTRTITLHFEGSSRHCRTVAKVVLKSNSQGLQWIGKRAQPLRVNGYGEWSAREHINNYTSYTCWREIESSKQFWFTPTPTAAG